MIKEKDITVVQSIIRKANALVNAEIIDKKDIRELQQQINTLLVSLDEKKQVFKRLI